MKIDTGDRFSAKKSTLIYLGMALLIVVLIVIFLVMKVTKDKGKNFTNGYDTVYSLGSYSIKLNTLAYLEDEQSLRFVYYCKRNERAYGAESSTPSVSEVRVIYDDKGEKRTSYPYTVELLNDVQSLYEAKGTELKDARAVLIFLQYKDADYYDPDRTDEFGDVKKGEFHEGAQHSFYIVVDASDIPHIKKNEYAVPALNSNDMDNAQTVSSSASTVTTTSIATEEVTTTTPSNTATTTTTISTSVTTTTTTTTPKPASSTSQQPKPTASTSVTAAPKQTSTTSKTTTSTTTTTSKPTTTTTTTTTTTRAVKLTRLALNVYVVEISVGSTSKIEPVYEPATAKPTFEWSSNRTDRVTVDQNGNVKAVGKGKAIITCTCKENPRMTASCMVDVK